MKSQIKTILQLILLLCSLTVLAYMLFIYVTGMGHYPLLMPAVPVFYFLESIFFCYVLYDAKKNGNEISLKKAMLLRVARITGSIVLLIAGALADGTHLLSFTAVVVVYYLAYLIMESKIMIDMNKRNFQ